MKWTRAAAFPVGLVVAAVAGLTFLGLRFANPDMTETRLLLSYWPIAVAGASGGCLAVWSMEGWR